MLKDDTLSGQVALTLSSLGVFKGNSEPSLPSLSLVLDCMRSGCILLLGSEGQTENREGMPVRLLDWRQFLERKFHIMFCLSLWLSISALAIEKNNSELNLV